MRLDRFPFKFAKATTYGSRFPQKIYGSNRHARNDKHQHWNTDGWREFHFYTLRNRRKRNA